MPKYMRSPYDVYEYEPDRMGRLDQGDWVNPPVLGFWPT